MLINVHCLGWTRRRSCLSRSERWSARWETRTLTLTASSTRTASSAPGHSSWCSSRWADFSQTSCPMKVRNFKRYWLSDPYVFGSPGSISQRYRSGSFNHQVKIVRKTLIPTVLWFLFDFLSLKNDVNVLQKVISRIFFFLISFLLASWRSMTKIARSGSRSRSGFLSQRHGDADPDPYQNDIDPQHCFKRFWLIKQIVPFPP